MVTKVNSSNFAPAVNATITAASSIPTVTGVQATDSSYTPLSSNYLDTVGTAYTKITGTNFFAGSQVFIEGQLASSITYISATQLNVILPNKSAGTYVLYVVNPDGSVAIRINAVTYSASPVWSTSSILTGANNDSVVSIQLAATSDSSIVYTVTSGTLPPGLSLSTSGLLSGTVTGVTTETTYNFTVTATDTENQVNPSSFSINVTVSDPYFKNTILMNGETTISPFVKDASTNNLGLTITGDTRADKFSPYYGDGYYSVYTYDGLHYVGFNQPALSTSFTIEFWVFPTTAGSNNYFYQGGSTSGPLIGFNGSTFSAAHQGSWTVASSSNPTLYTWSHIALVREGTGTNQFKLYINGTLTGTGTDSTVFGAQTGSSIGSPSGTVLGYISNFRMVSNQALYTGSFTPPTSPLTASTVGTTGANVAASLTGTTVLLTAQSARFVDKSTNNLTMTPSGTPQISPAIPFIPNSSYSTYGSAYFDGTGDMLTNSTLTPLGSGDFTVECWAYATVVASGRTLFSIADSASSPYTSMGILFYSTTNWQLFMQNSAGTTIVNSNSEAPVTTYPINTWHHHAVTRSGSTIKWFINGTQVYTTASGSGNLSGSGVYLGYSQALGAAYWTGYIADFRVIKGTALYTTTFTPPTQPLTAITNTQLLALQYNGGTTGYGVIDNSTFNHALTRYGNTTQGTFSPYSQTGWGYYFNGSSALKTPASSLTTILGTSTVTTATVATLEFWVYETVRSTETNARSMVGEMNPTAGSNDWGIGISSSGYVNYSWYTGSVNNAQSSTTIVPLNTWTHVAVVWNTGNIKIFVNGILQTLTTNTITNVSSTHGYLSLGGWNNFSASEKFTGYVSNLRVTKSAVYAATFTPSTSPLTPIASTSLLYGASNRFQDISTNTYTLTVVGTPLVQSFSPFSPGVAYTPSLHGGSAYFDGTGDYLSIPSSTAFTFTGDFTIEAWVYPNVINADNCIISRWTSSLSFIFKIVSSGRPYFAWYKGGSGTVTGTSTAVLINQWNHVAVTRVGSTVRLFVNGTLDSTTGTIAGALDNSTTAITVGSLDTTPSQVWNGYLSDVRVINGTSLYSASFTPPTSPLTNTTSTNLLLNFTNAGIIDASSRSILDQATSPPPQISTSVKKFGNASIACLNGTYMYNSTTNPNFIIGTGDFTFEAWIFLPSTNVNGGIIGLSAGIASEQINIHLYFNVLFPYFAGSARNAGTAPSNTWNHYAIVRYNGVTKFYLDGVFNTSIGAVTDTTNYTGYTLALGVYQSSYHADCYIDDLRITKGYARYTNNFTAPTEMKAR